ncbi:MAG: carbon storage regulator CsrA [Gammaproteobacteria bacterium]
MLILTRCINEKLMLNDDIEIIILNIKHRQVRIGIKAPKDIIVQRGEIYIKTQNDKPSLQKFLDKISSFIKKQS